MLDLVHVEDRERIVDGSKENARAPGLGHFEVRVQAKGGEWRWISAAVTVGNGLFFVVSRDVTAEREQSREQAQAQKLEAVGQLASGVAHEINTPVQFVGDNVQFLSDSFSDLLGYLEAVQAVLTPEQQQSLEEATRKADLEYLQEEVPRSLSEAKDGVRRVAELVRALKEFAHPDQPEKTVSDLNKALERAAVLARGELKHLAAVELKLGAIPPIPCHVGSLSQVFVNLLVNAAHAVEERTQKFNVPAQQQRVTVRTWVEDDEVAISFSDTGCGIPESIRERVFEPFFTTKPMGKGTGQGLPLVRNVVVRKHGGRIELESVVNEGTTFTLRLPIDAARGKKAA